jgi:predicted dehydrogenase
MVEVAKQSAKTLKCGFNLRHHPGVRQIKKWCDAGIIGELTFLRCRYGMCGRIGYEKDWRGNKAMSGGGELLDQGVHILDLFRWFAGDFPEVTGFTATNYWNIAPLEDNAFALLRSNNKQIASLHVSWCQWRNLFSFEIFGKDGYVAVEGLGGSYGVERAILGRKSFTEPFKEEIIDFRGDDYSWRDEWREFVTAITEGREPLGSGLDGLEALKLVHAIYKSNQKSSMVTL